MIRPILWSLAINDVVDMAAAVALTPTPITMRHRSALAQRDDKIKTITLGDIDQYRSYQGADKIAKREVAIFPTGVVTNMPDEGIHVVFGPDMQKDMTKVIEEKCRNPDNMADCHKQLQDLLEGSAMPAHTKRIVPVIAVYAAAQILTYITAAVVGAIGGYLVGTGVNAVVANVNYEDISDDGVLAQIHDIGDATAIAIATGAENKVMATVSVSSAPSQSTHKPEEAIRISEVTEDSDESKIGDVKIEIPGSTAVRLKDFMGVMGLEQVEKKCQSRHTVTIRPKRWTAGNLAPRNPPPVSDHCSEIWEQLAFTTLEESQNGALQQINPVNTNNPFNPDFSLEGAVVPNIRSGGNGNTAGNLVVVHIYRRYVRRHPNLSTSALKNLLATAAAVVEAVAYYVNNDPIVISNIDTIILMSDDDSIKQTLQSAECSKDLVCVEGNCEGTMNVAGEWKQTSTCWKSEVRGCLCTEVEEPIVHQVEEGYMEALEEWRQQVLSTDMPATCDNVNLIQGIDRKAFEEHIESACKAHELRELGKRDQHGFWWSEAGLGDVQWSFDWNGMSDCDMKCEDIFKTFTENNKCSWNDGVSGYGFIDAKCGIATYSVDKPDSPECFDWGFFGAPHGRQEVKVEGGEGTAVDEAIEQFCNDNDGRKVFDQDRKRDVAKRWGFSEWRVPNRNSYWLKAEYKPYPHCQGPGEETIRKTNCKVALKQGMIRCAAEKNTPTRTKGFKIRGLGCINYSLHLSGDMRDNSPPWDQRERHFPPSIDAETFGVSGHPVRCLSKDGRPISEVDREKAIAAICKNGVPIIGYGTRDKDLMFDWPPKSQRPFYTLGNRQMYLEMGAQTVNQGAPEPYRDMKHYEGYDWKLGQDDCTYAMRRIYGTCSPPGELGSGMLTYRCVMYKATFINYNLYNREERNN